MSDAETPAVNTVAGEGDTHTELVQDNDGIKVYGDSPSEGQVNARIPTGPVEPPTHDAPIDLGLDDLTAHDAVVGEIVTDDDDDDDDGTLGNYVVEWTVDNGTDEPDKHTKTVEAYNKGQAVSKCLGAISTTGAALDTVDVTRLVSPEA